MLVLAAYIIKLEQCRKISISPVEGWLVGPWSILYILKGKNDANLSMLGSRSKGEAVG